MLRFGFLSTSQQTKKLPASLSQFKRPKLLKRRHVWDFIVTVMEVGSAGGVGVSHGDWVGQWCL